MITTGLIVAGLGVGSMLLPPSDDSIRRSIVENELAEYHSAGKICPCPYSLNQVGRLCGGQSEYSRSRNSTIHCYPDEITDSMILEWRLHHR